MKKLKVVLTLLLALCCSLCMFACGGAKNISGSDITGQKLSFKEGEEFSVGPDIKVVVYYQGDDNGHELKPEEYDVDSSAYNKDLAGEYAIYIIPKNQPKELTEGGKDNRWKYYYSVTVEHDWQDKGNGQYECSCGAKRNNYAKLNDQITTVAWGQQAVFTPGAAGETYPDAKAPIPGENHVSYGSLVKGQSLKLSIQITGLTGTENPATASAWDTPLMGIRNATVGMLPREDGWVIGVAAGFSLPETSNVAAGGNPVSGLATAADAEWTVYGQGTTWSAGSAFPKDGAKNGENLATDWSKVDVEYIYQADDIFMIRHTLHKFDGTDSVYTVTTKVPDNAYEVVVYGEYCNFTITAADFVAGRAIETFEVTKDPTNTVQPEGKLFDTTGLGTKAVFSDKGELTNSYNAYAFHDVTPAATDEVPNPTPVKTRVSLGTTPLTADMYDFMVEFNGKQAWLTKDGKESTAENKEINQKIKVVATPVTGANTSVITVGETAFEAPDVTYDYTVTSTTDTSAYIKLVAEGSAVKATDAQKAALGDATHFIAFKLVTTLKAEDVKDEITATSATGVVVKAAKAGNTVDVVVGLKDGFAKTFDLSLNETTKVLIDLNGLAALSKYGAEIKTSNFTLDAGGTYTVEYTGLGSAADINKLILPVVAKRDTVETVKAAAKGTYTTGTPTEDNSYKASNSLYITKVDVAEGKLTVTYWLAAPELGNLTAAACTTEVSLRDGETTLATANLTYKLEVSDKAIEIGDGVYVKANGNKLQVYTFGTTADVKDGLAFSATVNIEHPEVAGETYQMLYNVGMSIVKGAAAWADENVLTTGNTSSAAKLIALGTVNDATDYDKGYILVANLHLPALGVREGSEHRSDIYHFTANEDVDAGQETYTVYTVGTEKDNNVITPNTTTPGTAERVEFVGFTCLRDGWSAYETTLNGNKFYYGALKKAATGNHTWKATAEVDGGTLCTVCGAAKYSAFGEGFSAEVVALPADKAVPNTDLSDAWWNNGEGGSAVGPQTFEGNFVVQYTWDNERDPFWHQDAVVEVINGTDKYLDINFAANNPWGGSWADGAFGDGKNGSNTMTAWKDGQDVTSSFVETFKQGADDQKDDAGKLVTTGLGTEERWKGAYTLTIYRVGNTFTIIQKIVNKAATPETYIVKNVVTIADEIAEEKSTVQLVGNPWWCDNIKTAVGQLTTTTTGIKDIVIGTQDCEAAYTGDTPLWTMAFTEGMKVTVKGKHNSKGGDVYMTALAYLYGLNDEGKRAGVGLNFRLDHWINGADEADKQTTEGSVAAYNFAITKSVWFDDAGQGADWFGSYKKLYVGKDLDLTITWDWTISRQIVVAYTLVGTVDGAPAVFHMNYTIKSISGKLPVNLELGLGTDHAYYVVNEMSVTK